MTTEGALPWQLTFQAFLSRVHVHVLASQCLSYQVLMTAEWQG